MKYKVKKEKKEGETTSKININGYSLPSRRKCFTVGGMKVKKIILVNKKFAHPFVSKVVKRKYKRLINILTDLLVSDDDTGTAMMQVLNQIEKFKQEIKNKYRKYLKRKEVTEMSKKLKFIQKQALEKQMILQNSMKKEKRSNRSR